MKRKENPLVMYTTPRVAGWFSMPMYLTMTKLGIVMKMPVPIPITPAEATTHLRSVRKEKAVRNKEKAKGTVEITGS